MIPKGPKVIHSMLAWKSMTLGPAKGNYFVIKERISLLLAINLVMASASNGA